jgi:hypothetical protein
MLVGNGLFLTGCKLPFHSAQLFDKHIHIVANLAVNHFGVNLRSLPDFATGTPKMVF